MDAGFAGGGISVLFFGGDGAVGATDVLREGDAVATGLGVGGADSPR